MKFVTAKSIIDVGNSKTYVNELFNNHHLLSYVNNTFIVSGVESITEIQIIDDVDVVNIDFFDIQFSANHPIVVKSEEDVISVASFKPDNKKTAKFDIVNHKIFNGEEWVKLENFEIVKYSGSGYDLISKDGNFFLNSLLMSN